MNKKNQYNFNQDSSVFYFKVDRNGWVFDFSASWYDYTGLSSQKIRLTRWVLLVHEQDRAYLKSKFKNQIDNEFTMDVRIKHISGEFRWIHLMHIPDRHSAKTNVKNAEKTTAKTTAKKRHPKKSQFLIVCADIHEKKIMLEKLKESEHRLNLMFETSPSFMCVLEGPVYKIVQANAHFYQLVGHRDMLGKNLVDAMPEIKGQGFLELLDGVRKTGRAYLGKELPVMLERTAGVPLEKRFVDFVYQADKSEPGEVTPRIFVHGNDVTEKVLARTTIENERENFRILFRQTPEIVSILQGPQHIFEFVNKAHIRALGFDATGMTVREAQPESVEVYDILDNVYSTGQSAELFEIPVTVGHSLRYFNLTYVARRDEQGVINGIMMLGTEVTNLVLSRAIMKAQNEALALTLKGASTEEILNILNQLIEDKVNGGVLCATYLLDSTLEHLVYGASIGLPDEFNQKIKEINIKSSAVAFAQAVFSVRPVIVQDIEKDPHWSEYSKFALQYGLRSCWSIPIFSSEHKVIAVFVLYYKEKKVPLKEDEDLLEQISRTAGLVIEKKKTQDDLELARIEAENARQVAEAASESKTRFLANMSHEIRTPLTAILGFTDLLQDQKHNHTSEVKNYLDRISRNATQLKHLLDELLDLSKIEANKLDFENSEFDVRAAIDDALASVTLRAENKGITLTKNYLGQVPKKIKSDPTRFKQILTNVIGNAIKFTEKGHVDVQIQEFKTGQKSLLSIRVTDTGLGISDENQKKIFRPFVQADSSVTRKFGGTGLGLILSKQLARHLGGDLILEQSQIDHGSTFLITIDCGQIDMNQQLVQHSNQNTDTHPTISSDLLKDTQILVVDDSEDNQTIMELFIESAGGQVDLASNGKDALEKMNQKKYDIVLMDIQMPILDGYAALKEALETGHQEPIVAVTAHAMKDEKDKCFQSGFKDYLSKPVDREMLINKIYYLTHQN